MNIRETEMRSDKQADFGDLFTVLVNRFSKHIWALITFVVFQTSANAIETNKVSFMVTGDNISIFHRSMYLIHNTSAADNFDAYDIPLSLGPFPSGDVYVEPYTTVGGTNLYSDVRSTNSPPSTFRVNLRVVDNIGDGVSGVKGISLTALKGISSNYYYNADVNLTGGFIQGGQSFHTNFNYYGGSLSVSLPNTYNGTNGANLGYVDMTPIIASAYDWWNRGWFTESQLADPSVSGDFANPAGDGIVNLLKYALGLNPTNGTVNGLPTAAVSSNNYLTLTYRQNKQATDISYAVEACGSLVPNSWSTNGLVVISQADSNTYWSVTVRDSVPMTNAVSRFMRLKVIKP